MFPSATVMLHRVLACCSLQHVQALLIAGETRSVQRAAEAVGLVPASLELILGELEDMLGTQVLRQDGDTLEPTPAGYALLPHARHILSGVAGGIDALVAYHRRERMVVRVLASSAAADHLLMLAAPAFQARYARMHVQWREGPGEDTVAAIRRGEADFAAGRRPAEIPEGWAFHELPTDRFAVVCAPDNPLARAAHVSWQGLSEQPWLLPPAGSAARERFEALMTPARKTSVSYCVVPSIDDVADWLLHDAAVVGFVPVTEVQHLLLEGELVQLHPEHPVQETLGLLQPRHCSEPALRLAGFLQHFVAAAPGLVRANPLEPLGGPAREAPRELSSGSAGARVRTVGTPCRPT